MSNSGSENSIKIADDIFEAEKERVYLELFQRTTNRALDMAEELQYVVDDYPPEQTEAMSDLLDLLRDIEPSSEVDASMKQGATYKQLAYISHLAKLDSVTQWATKEWYATAKAQGLTKRHAGHIIARLNEISQGTAEIEAYVRDAGTGE
jgi:hypothetical protein